MRKVALTVAGVIFTAVAILHGLRYYEAWEVIVGTYHLPLHWSIYAGIVSALLAVWMFVATIRK